MVNPRSKATINPNSGQMASRHIGRVKTLRMAIEKAKSRKQTERVADLKAELDRRMADIKALKAELDNL